MIPNKTQITPVIPVEIIGINIIEEVVMRRKVVRCRVVLFFNMIYLIIQIPMAVKPLINNISMPT
jgi:hypothetical protein